MSRDSRCAAPGRRALAAGPYRAAAVLCAALLVGGCGRPEPSSRIASPELPPVVVHADRPAGRSPDSAGAPPAPVHRAPGYFLTADTVIRGSDTEAVQLRRVGLVLLDSLGQTTATLTSTGGEYDPRTETMVARGDVVVYLREPGGLLRTEELYYRPREDRVWSAVPSAFERAGLRMEGESFTSNSRFDTVSIQRAHGRLSRK